MKSMSIAVLTLALCACSSTGQRGEPLPFHVAVIPVDEIELELDPEQPAEGMRLRVDAEQVTRAVGQELGKGGFVRTTVLAPPEDMSAEAFASLNRDQRDEYWVEAARRAGADVLFEADIVCQPDIEHYVNSRAWADVPLFLLGGPLCWFVDDRSYEGQARLSGRLYDLAPIFDGRATLDDGASRLVDVQARFAKVELDLLDRSNGRVGPLVASILVPPFFLARGGEKVEGVLARKACQGLADSLVEGVREEGRAIREADHLVRFQLAEGAGAWRDGDGVRVVAEVLQLEGGSERLDTWSLRCDGVEALGEFDDGRIDPARATSRSTTRVFQLDARIGVAQDARWVQLELADAGLHAARRTWTLPVLAGPAPTPAPTPPADVALARAGD